MLLFGFAMVVPPALAVTYTLYWKRTTEAGAFWGMLLGLVGGLGWYVLTNFAVIEQAESIDPSYPTTLIPLIAIPVISLLTPDHVSGKDAFFAKLAASRVQA